MADPARLARPRDLLRPRSCSLVELETRRRQARSRCTCTRAARATGSGAWRPRSALGPCCARRSAAKPEPSSADLLARDKVTLRSVPMKGDSGTFIHDRRDGERKVALETHAAGARPSRARPAVQQHARRRARSGCVRGRRDTGAHDRAGRDLRTTRRRSRRDGREGRRRSRGRPAAALRSRVRRTC